MSSPSMATPADSSNDNGSSICCASTTAAAAAAAGALDVEALRRMSENLEAAFVSTDLDFCADARLAVSGGRELAVHRCMLAARSPFFRSVFSAAAKSAGEGPPKAGFELRELAREFEVGYDALAAVVAYLYSGRVRDLPTGVCSCVDHECPHDACRPVVEFMVEALYASFTFLIAELVTIYQRRIVDVLDKVAVDDLLVILKVANICCKSCEGLLSKCIEMVARSNLDVITLEKTLSTSPDLVKTIATARSSAGLDGHGSLGYPNKHVKRIHRALDSDDVELVRMLLKEGHTTLDESHALHYAVAFCDLKTTMELLELGIADVNRRNHRGYTMLHLAAMRKEPKIIVSLLTKGACTTDLTLDGRKALQISKRLTKSIDYFQITEEGKPSSKDKLCVEILEQAERRQPLLGEASASLATVSEDFRSNLLYYETRVGLAKFFFPAEAKVAMEIAQVDGTSELPLSDRANHGNQKEDVDLNYAPFEIKEEHRARLKALAKTVELGKRYFPRCSEVLNKIMDNDDLTNFPFEGPEDQLKKKIRLNEIQAMLKEAFTADKEEREKSTISSCSSSTSMDAFSTSFRRK